MTKEFHDTVRAIRWQGGCLELLDQRLLPQRTDYISCADAAQVADAIRQMVVRGAPAIGVAAAYGVALAVRHRFEADAASWRQALEDDLQRLAGSRPTAVNLFWAIERMRRLLERVDGDPREAVEAEARRIHDEDIAANRRMGDLGAALIEQRCDVLTHCNTGSLATAGYGTALGVIRSAYAQGRINRVYADETRPWLQGARLTAWELSQDRIPYSLLADGAASYLMKQGRVRWVIVGADRVAANGDVANKIGTYGLAVAARHHGVKFMVVAPTSTVDLNISDGSAIPIEQREAAEVLQCGGQALAPADADAWNPVFDVTPAALIDALVTEKGVVRSPTAAKLAAIAKPR